MLEEGNMEERVIERESKGEVKDGFILYVR